MRTMSSAPPLKIFLAHLYHPKYVSRIAAPLDLGTIANCCKQLHGAEVEISLFADAEELIAYIQSGAPLPFSKDNMVDEKYDFVAGRRAGRKGILFDFKYDKPVKKNYHLPHYKKLLNIVKMTSGCLDYNYFEQIVLQTFNLFLIRLEKNIA